MRQQFDPRQLEELVRLRSEAAAQAAASFDVPSEMQLASAATHDNGAAGEEVMVRWRRLCVRTAPSHSRLFLCPRLTQRARPRSSGGWPMTRRRRTH